MNQIVKYSSITNLRVAENNISDTNICLNLINLKDLHFQAFQNMQNIQFPRMTQLEHLVIGQHTLVTFKNLYLRLLVTQI